jgi:hypothetical protein
MPFGWLKDKLSDAAEAAWDAVTEVADTAVDAVGTVASGTGDVIGGIGTVVDTATFGAASAVLNVVDNTVLDTVDEVTGGLVDVDYDDGNISAKVGVEGLAHVGASVGEDGLRHSASAINQSFDLGLGDDGLSASGQAGIDWGPLPYAEGSAVVETDGDVALDGRAQGTIPTPIGVLSGRAEAGFVREGDMWAGNLDADGSLLLPDGDVIKGGVEAAYAETSDGSLLSLGLEGAYSRPGEFEVGGSVGYDRIDQGGVLAERFEAGAYASAHGGRVEAGFERESVTTADGSVSHWEVTGSASLEGESLGSIGYGSSSVTENAPAPFTSDVTGAPHPEPIAQGQPMVLPALEPVGPAPMPEPVVPAPVPEPIAPAPMPEPVAPAPVEAAPPPPETSEFEHTIAAAENVEASVDDMFSDLG